MVNETTKKRILLIEDDSEELKKAERIFKEKGYEVISAQLLKDALRHLDRKEKIIDGVISDIYFPMDVSAASIERNTGAFPERGKDYGSLEPCGLAVANICDKHSIPFILCTSFWHHANRIEWIYQLASTMGWKLIEGKGGDPKMIYLQECPEKDWARALEELEKIM